MKKPIKIGAYSFVSVSEANVRLTEVLHSVPHDGEYTGELRGLVEAVFYARLDKVARKGDRGIVRFRRGRNAYGTSCFYADLDDGSTLDFSFMKLLQGSTDRAA